MQLKHTHEEYRKTRIDGATNAAPTFPVEACLIRDESVNAAYQLRHKVFAEELKWVPQAKNRLERDSYDKSAQHFGVFRDKKILSYLRLVSPAHGYMLEKEFSSLVSPGHILRKTGDTREVSRLCVSVDERATKIQTGIGPVGAAMLLYRRVYQWCFEYDVRYLYLVVEYKVYRLLSMLGFPCDRIGDPTKMPDGVMAVAAMMDWRHFETRNILKRPDLINWFNQYQESQDGLPLPQLGHDLQHRVSA